MKTLAVILVAFVLLSSIALAKAEIELQGKGPIKITQVSVNDKAVQADATDNSTQDRGKGLDNAITHVPDFVAEKLSYMRGLFSDGIKGIGQSLSDWIHSFFRPVVSGNETSNKTK